MLTNPTFSQLLSSTLKIQPIQKLYVPSRLRHHRFNSRKMLTVFGIEDIFDHDNRLMLKLPHRERQLETHIVDNVPVGHLFKFAEPVLII